MSFRQVLRGAGIAAALVLFSLGLASPVLADDLEDAVAAADPAAGEQLFRQCMSCHTATEGGPTRVGPNLWGVVDRQIGSVEGFRYSRALTGSEDHWTLENLNAFIESPRTARPGTSMTYAGIRNLDQRMAMLAYLATLGGEKHEREEEHDEDSE